MQAGLLAIEFITEDLPVLGYPIHAQIIGLVDPANLDNKCLSSWNPTQAFLSYIPVAAFAYLTLPRVIYYGHLNNMAGIPILW